MAIPMQGSWTVSVKSKSAALPQRFIIAGADSGNGTYVGAVATPPVAVTGAHWRIQIQNDPGGGFIDSADQIKFLDLTLEEMAEMQGETDALLAAWRTGNAAKLASILSEEYGVAPGLYATLVSDRNRRWIPQIEKLLKADKNYMVVVGALHIVGKNGLLDLLKAEGFTSHQLQ